MTASAPRSPSSPALIALLSMPIPALRAGLARLPRDCRAEPRNDPIARVLGDHGMARWPGRSGPGAGFVAQRADLGRR
jgi:hypothetical protein